jgi:UDP-glucuronate 4-epimerase
MLSRLALLQINPAFRFVKGDLADRNLMSQLFSDGQFQRVIHLGAQAGVRYSLDNPHAYADANLVGHLNILEGCRQHKIEHLLYASSSSVYGLNRKTPFSTTDSVDHPVSLYAATKKANELMSHSYAHLYGLPCTGLRFFTVYGPWGRPDMALFKFTKAILAGQPIDVYNFGEMKLDNEDLDVLYNMLEETYEDGEGEGLYKLEQRCQEHYDKGYSEGFDDGLSTEE